MMDTGITPVWEMNNRSDTDGFNGSNNWWIILFFFMMFWRNGNWGNDNNGIQDALTRSDLCAEFNNNNLQRSVNSITQEICNNTSAINNAINGVNANMSNGLVNLNTAICNLGYNTQQGFNQTNMTMMQTQNAIQAQLAECCCNVQNSIKDVNYAISVQTNALSNQLNHLARDITEAQNAGTRAILDKMCQDQISNLQNEVQSLRFDKSQYQQNETIGAMINASTAEVIKRTGNDYPTSAYVVQPPVPVTFPNGGRNRWNGYDGYYNDCGRGCGYGC